VNMVRCASVDVLRAIAALAVAWFHFTNGQSLFLEDRSLSKTSGAYGYLGVPIFGSRFGSWTMEPLASDDFSA
jgi:peptidoglycan/LPS O-acetylase OafA/YrhL